MLNLSSLNPEQRLAVETVQGPVLILAGAGTGKTRVITHRIGHMVQRGIAPANVLAVTFTNKAAREMQERVRKLLPKQKSAKRNRPKEGDSKNDDRPTICTFHSLCVRILRQHIEKLGYKRNFVIYDQSEQLSAVKKIMAQISSKGEKSDPAAVLALLSRFKNGGERASIFADESLRALAEHIRNRYETALRACNAVDFDDLILLTLRLFQEHPEALEACRAKYRYVMVDEYQDTNASQFNLVHSLTQEHRNICVVGDDDQSIYGWRGAEISNLLDMEKHFPEVKLVKLEQNYRSTSTILNAANAVIKQNIRRRGKKLWSDKGDGSKISLHTFESDEEEARTIVELIEYARMTKRSPWSEHAILFRTNLQSRPLETALRKAQVRYHLIGGQSFFDRREIRDFLAYLKVFLNPDDDVSLLRIANTPARGLSDVTMERLLGASHERKCSVFAAMKNPLVTTTFQSRTREAIEAFVEFVEKTGKPIIHGWNAGTVAGETAAPGLDDNSQTDDNDSNIGSLYSHGNGSGHTSSPSSTSSAGTISSLGAWADRFLDEIEYFDELRRMEKTPEAAESRIRNIQDLVASLENTDAGNSSVSERLQTFLEDITLDTEREEEDTGPENAVTLITMHSCKGLEFPHVYVVGLEDGLLPHSRSKVEGTMDEERRLFYVAITRAMQTLTISHCSSRKKYGQITPCHPSGFLSELPPELIEHADEKAKQPVTVETGKDMFAALRDALG